jgi:hypothetical protein
LIPVKVARLEGGALMRKIVVAALLFGSASVQAEPLELDERQLGAVAAGTPGLLGPVDVAVGVSTPTDVAVTPSTAVATGTNVDVANQVGTGVAAGTTTALGVLADGVAAAGLTGTGITLGSP